MRVHACVLSVYLIPMWNASFMTGLLQKTLKALLTGSGSLASKTSLPSWICSLSSLSKGLCFFTQGPSNPVQIEEIIGIMWEGSASWELGGPLTSWADLWWPLLNLWVRVLEAHTQQYLHMDHSWKTLQTLPELPISHPELVMPHGHTTALKCLMSRVV